MNCVKANKFILNHAHYKMMNAVGKDEVYKLYRQYRIQNRIQYVDTDLQTKEVHDYLNRKFKAYKMEALKQKGFLNKKGELIK